MLKKVVVFFSALCIFAVGASAEMPGHAQDIVIKHLGQKMDPQTRRMVDGYAIYDYRKGHMGKPDHAGGGKDKGGSTCFAPLARGASWATAEPYIMDFTDSGLDTAAAETVFVAAAEEWNNHTSYDVFGAGTLGISSGTIGFLMNGVNEVDFGFIAESGVIAVTYVWGIFSGPPHQRILSEWDMRFSVFYAWAMDGAVTAMDFENIAQHELGHALGLGHPEDTCTEETMFAYADFGETKKRDLNEGDIAGAVDLY